MITILIIILLVILFILAWALFGSEEKPGAKDAKEERPEALLRRRATDREIEEKFPDRQARPQRRKSDLESLEHLKDVADEFKLPYITDEIISEASRFRVYRRTLMNAEIYAKKGDFQTATSLYEGVVSRINDIETNRKIEANVEYLRRYREYLNARRKKEELVGSTSSGRPRELKLSLDGPLTIPDRIQIGLSAPISPPPPIDIDHIAERISQKLNLDRSAGPDDEEINRYRDEVDRLERRLDDLSEDLAVRKTGDDAGHPPVDMDQLAERISVKLNLDKPSLLSDEKIDRYRDEVERLEHRLDGLSGDLAAHKAVQEVQRRPAIIEAKYESPLPVVLDPKPILEILEKLPARGGSPFPEEPSKTPPSGAQTRPAPAPPGPVQPEPKKGEEVEDFRRETFTRDEKETPDEWELLSRYGKDEEQPAESLTDEDIFEKILSEDTGKKDDIQIIGDSRPGEALEYDARDSEKERKREDEERFYRKFLQHNRRKARELPILKVSYDFSKLPDEFSLAREKNILEYSYYKYKPMLERASEYLKKRKVKDAINYYKVVMSQNIPPEFKNMIRKNVNDLTEYLEKYLTSD